MLNEPGEALLAEFNTAIAEADNGDPKRSPAIDGYTRQVNELRPIIRGNDSEKASKAMEKLRSLIQRTKNIRS